VDIAEKRGKTSSQLGKNLICAAYHILAPITRFVNNIKEKYCRQTTVMV